MKGYCLKLKRNKSALKKKEKNEIEITPLVKSLSGVISIDKNFDEKEAYLEYLMEKYK